jgi:hypothetical protein
MYTFVAAQLALHDLDLLREVGKVRAVARREVVEDADVVATFGERAGEVRADEASAASHQDFH